MRKLLCILLLAFIAVGCGWRNITEKGARASFETLKAADTTSNVILHKRCMRLANECKTQGIEPPCSGTGLLQALYAVD